MPRYELINPSDYYTFEARDILIAGAVTMFLSSNFGAVQIHPEGDERTPMLFGWEEWFKSKGVDLHDPKWTRENLQAIAEAFESFVIGDRAEYMAGLEATLEADRPAFIEKWNNEKRSSVNDIGKAARSYATQCRKMLEAVAAG
jgi:hypothetical protein